MKKLIYLEDAIDELMKKDKELRSINWYNNPNEEDECRGIDAAIDIVSALPSVPPRTVCVAKITLSDEQIQEAVEKAKEEIARSMSRWIPCSERLPDERDWYLGIFKETDTGWINPIPFICDYVGKATKATTKEYWILRGFTDGEECVDYYLNLECVAWMPLPGYLEEGEKE